jgi:hypothetical protein
VSPEPRIHHQEQEDTSEEKDKEGDLVTILGEPVVLFRNKVYGT